MNEKIQNYFYFALLILCSCNIVAMKLYISTSYTPFICTHQDFDEVFLFEFFYALFVINDVDFSGTMDLDEFIETLASLGRPKVTTY